MSFLDELKRLARPYEDEDEEDYEEFEPAPKLERKQRERTSERLSARESEPTASVFDAPSERRGNKVVNIHTTTQLQVVLVKPDRLESVDKSVARRLLDFVSGVAYASDGKIKKVAIGTYIVTPFNVDILGDLVGELENNGLYNF